MNSPIDDVAKSFVKAVETDLNDVRYEWQSPSERREGKPPTMKSRRPSEDQCSVVMFPQMRGSTALGFGGMGGAAMTNAYTVIVTGPDRDACVYFGGRLAYHIERPNQFFREDMNAFVMVTVSEAKSRYESDYAIITK